MDLNAIRGPLSQKNCDCCIKNNLYLYCGKLEHRAHKYKTSKYNNRALAATQNQNLYKKQKKGPPQYLQATQILKPGNQYILIKSIEQ